MHDKTSNTRHWFRNFAPFKGLQSKYLLKNESLRLEYLAGPTVVAIAILFWFMAVKNITSMVNAFVDHNQDKIEQSIEVKKIPISNEDYLSALQSLKWLSSANTEVSIEKDQLIIKQKENLLEFPNWLYSAVVSTTLGKGTLWEIDSLCVGKCEAPAIVKLKGYRQIIDSKT